ncbi:hypothetical protein ACP70R_049598 [Stipagrostis hirtigluma subsp. patula]
MEGPIIASVLSNTLPRLYSAIEDRGKKGEGLERDVDSIKAELRYVEAAIRDCRQINRCDMSDLWRARTEDLRRLAYDMEDCVDSFRAGMIKSEQLPAKISELKQSAEDASKRLERYISEQSLKQAEEQDLFVQGPDTAVDQDNHEIVGMEEISNEIKDLLRESQISSERKLRVIFIVGFGGIGKTLLTNQIYRELCDQFPRHASVRAAGKDRAELLEEILKQLQQQGGQRDEGIRGYAPMEITEDGNGIRGCESASSGILQHTKDVRKRLESCLGTNRYFIVIDGIPTEEFASYVLKAFPPVNEVDSRIIVTTTIQSVAESYPSCRRHVCKMSPLNDVKSEELFLNVACEMDEPSVAEMEQSSVFRRKCDGVPLALVSMARFCNGHLSRCEDAWNKLCTSTPEPRKDYRLARMQRVLDHSYDTLCSIGLHQCLLYFCMFPSEYQIRRGSLIRQWMAEGPEVGCNTSADAEKNFKTLVDRNVIWPTQVGNNEKVKTCRPPAMMHEYIARESEKEKFVMLSCNNTHDAQCIRRLSIHHTGAGAGGAADNGQALLNDLLRLRTLAVFNEGEWDIDPLSFAQSVLLRVLHLEARYGFNDQHLEKICKLLKLLKYLSLRANVTEVPRIIANLQWLETLDLGKETVIRVPTEVLELPNLKHLLGKLKLFGRDGEDKKLKKFLSRKSALETLSGFDTGRSPGFPQLMRCMRRLRKVKIWCNSSASSRNTKDLSRSIKEFLRKAERTPLIPQSLSVDFHDCTEPFLDSVLAADEKHHGGLFSLKLRGVMNPVPAFVTKLCGITELCLSSTTLSWGAILVGVGNLKILEYLKLVAERNIQGDVVIQCEQFISLKRMCIVAEQSVPQITIRVGALKHLVSLHLLCPGLEGHSADQIQHLKSLKEVALHSAVAQGTWKEAARNHPNRPNVVFIDRS